MPKGYFTGTVFVRSHVKVGVLPDTSVEVGYTEGANDRDKAVVEVQVLLQTLAEAIVTESAHLHPGLYLVGIIYHWISPTEEPIAVKKLIVEFDDRAPVGPQIAEKSW